MTHPVPLVRGAAAAVGRRRAAPVAQDSSDVRRFVGVGVGALVGALTALGFAVATIEPASLRSPGPLARPHARAQLRCASCHAPDGAWAAPDEACAGCHGPHPSSRAGHRAQAQRGALRCTSCHRIHLDMGGVALERAADGSARLLRFGPGAEVVVPLDSGGLLGTSEPWTVPIVTVQSCAQCHAVGSDSDPIARCLLAGQEALGSQRPTACLDEHRHLDGLSITDAPTRARLSAWGLARQIVARAPVAPRQRRAPTPSWAWLTAGVLAGSLTWGGAQLLERRRRRSVRVGPVPSEGGGAGVVPEIRRLPVVNAATCIGCYACVDACPYDVLAIEQYVAKLVRPEDCCGLTLCEQRCPNGSLVVMDGDPIPDRPALDAALQSRDVPGLFLAGDLTGLPLIRNAINQGAIAVEGVARALQTRGGAASTSTDLDVIIVGAGPAGISAGLAAIKHGLAYRVVEQGSVAQSIRSFPRGKLVFDQPLGLPMVGDLWLAESTKEELVGKWLRIVRQQRLAVLEHTRVLAIDRDAEGIFSVRGQGDPEVALREVALREVVLRAPHVVLAIGRRGTPRKLPVALPDAALDRVHYSMADARSFAGQRVVVVGLGDVAMEAAVALSRQPQTTVVVAYRGAGFSRGKQRNVDELQRRIAAGRVELCLRTEVTAVDVHALTLRGPQGPRSEPWDALLVLIGTIAPWEFLERVGVRRGS